MDTREIEISTVGVSSLNTRKDIDAGTEDASLMDLANSIREQGLLMPIIVRPVQGGQYDVIAGQRRLLACRLLGWQTISATIRDDLDETEATVVSLIENVQRADLNPIDKARAYSAIYDKHQDVKRVAKETGVTVPTVRRYLALLDLSPSIQEEMTAAEGYAGVETLSELAKTFSAEDQQEVLEQIGGFKGSIQKEILKKSHGDMERIPELVEQAREHAFDMVTCKELLCVMMPPDLKDEILQRLGAQQAAQDRGRPGHLAVQ